MKYRVTIRKEGSKDTKSIIDAESRFEVYKQVQNSGGTVVELSEGLGVLAVPTWVSYKIGTGVKRREIIQMTRNLATMLDAGLSLSRALSVIDRQSSNKHFKVIIDDISNSIKTGASFHEALAKYPHIFTKIFVSMVRAGEESGSLADSLKVVGLQMEKAEDLARKIRGAMIYPSIIIIAVIAIGILMLIYVVPTLTSTFSSLGVKAPLATRVIVSMSTFITTHSTLMFMVLVGLILSGVTFIRSAIGGKLILTAALSAPVIGELVRETLAARTSRTLSSLLSSGVPVLEALSITKDVVHADVFAKVVQEAEDHVRKGEPLSQAFSDHPRLYPVLMSDMLTVGEETGKVADMLKQVAEFYEEDVSQKTKDLSTIIEPVLMLIIGVVVGIFAVAMIAPIYQLSSAI